jgi:putative ABC transport system permease protein
VQHRADDLVSTGMPHDEAVRQARLELGAVEAYKEKCPDASGFASLRVLHGFGADLKVASRRLLATPMFTIFAVLSLALGVGVTTAVYSSVDTVLWKDRVIPESDRVAVVMGAEAGQYTVQGVVSVPDFEDFRATQQSFASITAAYRIVPSLVTPDTTILTSGEAVDAAYFDTLAVDVALGRPIQRADVETSAPVVVFGHWLWRSRFASDPSVIGRTIRLAGRPFEVVGVAPEGFQGAVAGPRGPQLWVPSTTAGWFGVASGRTVTIPERDRRRLTVVGRLRPGVTVETASAELGSFAQSLDAAYPRAPRAQGGGPPRRGWFAKKLDDTDRERSMNLKAGLLIVGLVALVLVVACTNLSNLILARGTMRHQELAVRGALGAPRWRLVREQLAETVLIALLGGVASYGVLRVLMVVLNVEIPIGPSLVVPAQPQINATALAVTVGALLLALVVFGLEPALRLTSRRDVRDALAAGGGSVGTPTTKRQHRLLRWQVAISAGFFIIASMSAKYLANEARHDPGVVLDRMAVAIVSFYAQQWDETTARAAVDRILREGARTPGVDAVAVSTGLPFGTTITPGAQVSTPDKPILPRDEPEWAMLMAVTSGYFRAAGTPLLRGRAFDDRDTAGARRVVVIGESAARKLFGTSDAVGREMLLKVNSLGFRKDEEPRLVTVVGIAADADTTHYSSRRSHTVYLPFAQEYLPYVTVIARTASASDAVPALRKLIRNADADVPVERIGTAHAILAGPHVFLRAGGIVAVSLGGLTLLLAMVGLYGVQSQVVSLRTREIGVRMSLGATAAQVRTMVLKEGYKPVLQGLGIGLFIGIAGRAIIRSVMVAPMEIVDPWMLFVVPVPLLLAAFCACYLPARRASRVDPNVALRHL